MITLLFNDDTKKCFNLNNNEREEALYSAWFSMQGDEKYADKKINITTHTGEKLSLKISEIKDCKYEDCLFYGNPEIKDIKDKEEPKEEKPKSAYDFLEQRKKKNIDAFFAELTKRKINPKPDDEFLMHILPYVEKDMNGSKIKYYVNIFANYYTKAYR